MTIINFSNNDMQRATDTDASDKKNLHDGGLSTYEILENATVVLAQAINVIDMRLARKTTHVEGNVFQNKRDWFEDVLKCLNHSDPDDPTSADFLLDQKVAIISAYTLVADNQQDINKAYMAIGPALARR